MAATGASAQEAATDPSEKARFRFGPLRFTPSITLTNLGVDSNVFNETEDPKQDTTGAIGPAVDLWMHLGRSRLSGRASSQYVYFDKYKGERAWNTADELKWEVPLGRLVPFVHGSYSNTKNRSGFEIDSRVRQATQSVGVGTELKLSAKTSLVLTGRRSRIEYDDTQLYFGTDLAAALNERIDSEQLVLRKKLTALTTFVVNVEALQDRFDASRLRSADSIKVLPGFEMKPSALISGRVFVGYRRFSPLEETVLPAYTGPIATVDATLIARATRVGVRVGRDLSFSYEKTEPYYTLTDLGLTITERLSRSWDVVVSGGQETLEYKRLLTASTGVPPRSDRIRQYGGGVGYRIGRTLRFGLDGVYYRRRSSEVKLRDFEGLRAGVSISYGLSQ